MNSIVLWFDLARRSFRSQSVYRINVLVNLIYSFMSVLINVSVWNALYAQNVDPAATLSEAITYSVIPQHFWWECSFGPVSALVMPFILERLASRWFVP